MQIPRYWAKANYTAQNEDGESVTLACWHWSNISIDDARRHAQERARRITETFSRGHELNRYEYGIRPVREEIVEALSHDNREIGLITRNTYGALVLNAANAMFVDIDFKEKDLSSSLGGALNSFLGKSRPEPETAYLPAIEQWARRWHNLGVRVYRTAAGLRCLILGETFNPTDPGTEAMMVSLGGDPLYIRLCRHQESFRARLTPKPWRCGLKQPPSRYPWESATLEQQYRNWEYTYNRVSASYSVCRLVAQYGDPHVHPAIQPILTLHDQMSGINSNRNLA